MIFLDSILFTSGSSNNLEYMHCVFVTKQNYYSCLAGLDH